MVELRGASWRAVRSCRGRFRSRRGTGAASPGSAGAGGARQGRGEHGDLPERGHGGVSRSAAWLQEKDDDDLQKTPYFIFSLSNFSSGSNLSHLIEALREIKM